MKKKKKTFLVLAFLQRINHFDQEEHCPNSFTTFVEKCQLGCGFNNPPLQSTLPLLLYCLYNPVVEYKKKIVFTFYLQKVKMVLQQTTIQHIIFPLILELSPYLCNSGMYKVSHSPPLGGEFINSFGEEFQVVKRGRGLKIWERKSIFF